MKALFSTGAVVLGVVLVLASLVWGLVFPASSGWTDEKSAQLRELRNRAHILGGQVAAADSKPSMHKGANPAELKAEYEQVKAELQQLGEELDGKIDAPKTAATILRYAGIAFVVAGGLVVYTSKG
jgi:hypothetical protein